MRCQVYERAKADASPLRRIPCLNLHPSAHPRLTIRVLWHSLVDESRLFRGYREYISGSDWRIKANANTGYSNAGLIRIPAAAKGIANYWLDNVYSPEEGQAHRQGDVHIHDLDCLTGYCAGWSLRALLNEGFNGVGGRVSSRPPRYLREALGQMSNFLGIQVVGMGRCAGLFKFLIHIWHPMSFATSCRLPREKPSGNLSIILMSLPAGGSRLLPISRLILLFPKTCNARRRPVVMFIFSTVCMMMCCWRARKRVIWASGRSRIWPSAISYLKWT